MILAAIALVFCASASNASPGSQSLRDVAFSNEPTLEEALRESRAAELAVHEALPLTKSMTAEQQVFEHFAPKLADLDASDDAEVERAVQAALGAPVEAAMAVPIDVANLADAKELATVSKQKTQMINQTSHDLHTVPASHIANADSARALVNATATSTAHLMKAAGAHRPLKETMTHAELEEAITNLFKIGSLGLSKAELDATPFGKSVNKIRKVIETEMMPKVVTAHEGNQKGLNKLNAEIHKCINTKNRQTVLAQPSAKKYKAFSPKHISCRISEAGALTDKLSCWQDEKDKRKVMQLKCQAFRITDKKYSDQNANKVIVTKQGSEASKSYIARISSTICGAKGGKGNGGFGKKGFLDEFIKAETACLNAMKAHATQKKKCEALDKNYADKKKICNNLQDVMDGASCKFAVDIKDACEEFLECWDAAKDAYDIMEKAVKVEEKDRKVEWVGLKKMKCFVDAFGDGKVQQHEIDTCRKGKHKTDFLNITYPTIKKRDTCSVPLDYPYTPDYKKKQFAPLPAMAKGRDDANKCTGMKGISTKPAKGSPKGCKCARVTLNGPYSPGPMVKCVGCIETRRSVERNSCPDGTKIFSPRSRTDWKTIISSIQPLRSPNWIIDITRPQNGCGGCTKNAMSSRQAGQSTWVTADGSPWWLRSTRYNEPNGDYLANCYLDLWHTPKHEDKVTFNDKKCNYHSKSYYCQLTAVSTKPKKGSPNGCMCEKVNLNGAYSAGTLIKCKGCWRVSRTTQKNSCPMGTKLFSPASREDWKTFLASAKPLRSPHWIIDVTRPQNGCGGCTKSPMNSKVPEQATWRTADASPWWLRSSRYNEPNGDYRANCYLDLWQTPANENSVTFNDGRCHYRSNAYYCQIAKTRKR